jgi:hypothetical protein
VKILADPENSARSAEEVADLVLEKVYALVYASAKAEIRTETRREIFDKDDQARRLAVVGQIQFEGRAETHTVVLGPFHSQGLLSSEEKFRAVLDRACAEARKAGQDLTWDPKTKIGRGRFVLAPAFMRPRAAWDFFRPEAPIDPRLARITETIRRWEAGRWATDVAYSPVCHCGTLVREYQTSAGPAQTGPCPVHGAEAR